MDGTVAETDYPVARLLDELDAICLMAVFDRPFFAPERPGRFWLSVPLLNDRTAPVRLSVPRALTKDKPVPLVVALHGAGGTENLFFEGYGAGHIVKECEGRGWLLAAPRAPGFFGGPPVDRIIDALAERYPVDTSRVFLVGHSMGAAQAVAAAQEFPGRFAAVAALGGGGRVAKPKAFGPTPVFVGVGSEDFARPAAERLHKELTGGGVTATWKEYPDLEHLVIVREALPEVFRVFDGVAKR